MRGDFLRWELVGASAGDSDIGMGQPIGNNAWVILLLHN